MRNRMNRWLAVFGVAATLAGPDLALAASASSLGDLVGSPAGTGEQELRSRGFVMTRSSKGNGGSQSYFWGTRTQDCVMIMTRNSRYVDIRDADPSKCGQGGNSASRNDGNDEDQPPRRNPGNDDGEQRPPRHRNNGNNDNGDDLGRALGGLLDALTQPDGGNGGRHRDRVQPPQDDYSVESEFQRGLRDGSRGKRYRNVNESEAYDKGYRRGTRQRENSGDLDTPPDGGFGGNGGYGGDDQPEYTRRFDYQALEGGRARSAIRTLKSSGFRMVGQGQDNGAEATIWWRRASRECLQMVTQDGLVDSVNPARYRGCR